MSRFKNSSIAIVAAAGLSLGATPVALAQDQAVPSTATSSSIEDIQKNFEHAWQNFLSIVIGIPAGGSAVLGSLVLEGLGVCTTPDSPRGPNCK